MAGVPILAMKEAVVWHRFRNRFPYHVSPRGIQNNAFIVARIMFGERVFNEVFLPAMRSQGWDKKIEGLLKGDLMLKDIEAMEARRKVAPQEFVSRYFPNGIVDENDRGKTEKPEPMASSPAVSEEMSVSQVFTVPNVDCPYGSAKDNTAKQSFFENDLCKSRRNCKTCRTNKNFRKIIAERFSLPDGEFACPLGIVAEDFQDGNLPAIVREAIGAVKVVKEARGKPETIRQK
jgi:hypothetical protein